jgi:bifunctional UDP-N-acetylglucosamine pyrophosphorylase/glucosamine-1-phosphate N-acetyltransferase
VERRPVAVIVLAAGLGTRMRSRRAKVLHEVGGRPLLHYPLRALRSLAPSRVILVVGYQAALVRAAADAVPLRGLEAVVQAEQRGTGDAVRCAMEALAGFEGDVVVLYGDVPLIRPETLTALVDAHRREDAALTLLTLHFADPTGYGRIVRDGAGRIRGIVEERDASPAERAITEINPGFYCIRSDVLWPLIGRLQPNNAQGELYLTDVVGLAAAAGRRVASVAVADANEVVGVNSRAELAWMEGRVRTTLVQRFMDGGVTFEDPATAYLGSDVEIGPDTVIGPNVVLRGRTRIGAGCRLDGTNFLVDTIVGDGTHLLFGTVADGAEVGPGARIGPYARLRPGTKLGEGVHIGNFVETKKAIVGDGTKANHLSYLGDCEIGPDTNVGAGTITCNYDGFVKAHTDIGKGAFIGSNSSLVAPVKIGDGAYIGSGSVITEDVPAGSLGLGRGRQVIREGWVARWRERIQAAVKKKPGSAA